MTRLAVPVAVLATLLLATAAAAETRVLRVFTDADVPPAADRVVGGDGMWAVGIDPLYGGSDRSAFEVAARRTVTNVADNDRFTAVTVFDVPTPADLRPGDVLTGRVWVGTYNQIFANDPYAEHPFQAELTAVGAGGESTVVGRFTVPHDPTGGSPPLRLPVTFDAGHRPDRLRLQLVLPQRSFTNDAIPVFIDGLRLTHGDGPPVGPATRPTGRPSPPWPPADVVESDVRTFAGNDFDPHFADSVSSPNPVCIDGRATGVEAIDVTEPSAEALRTIPILSVDDPGVTAGRYAVAGTVTYGGSGQATDIDGFGYLQLDSDLSDGTHVVTRGLADAGPMRALMGRSGARWFALPVEAGDRRPTRVRLSLVMSGTGTVSLSGLQLVQYDPAPPTTQPTAAAAAAASSPPPPPPWWVRDRTTGLAVGLFGCVGFLGLTEPLMRRGRARGLVVAALVGVAVVGLAFYGWAMAVVGHGDGPRAWGPLLLCAAAAASVPAAIPAVNRRYREAELRRMRVLDAVAA